MSNAETKSPAELRAERFERLRSEWARLSGRVSLGQLHDEIEDLSGRVEGLSPQIEELRSRGYRFGAGWQAKVETLHQAWPARRNEARRILREQAGRMEGLAREIKGLCDRSALSDANLDLLENKLDRLESQVGSAETSVRGAFDSLKQQVNELERELAAVAKMLDWLDTASFDLYPDENGVIASEATWTNHPDEPEGILFLTDGRVVFEQRQKKAKKKVLFITTESELIQSKLWESPVGNIAELEAEDKKKFLSRKELLHLRFREYDWGLHGDVTLHLEGTTNEEWAGLIKRVQSDEIDADRYDAGAKEAAPVSEAEPAAPPAEIPTKCPACGAQLPALVKGMRELVCNYCSTVVRL
jgi:predicted nuclease with TOPRIM domain